MSRANDRGLRDPRLIKDLATLKAFDEELEDWRKLEAAKVFNVLNYQENAQQRSLLATALYVGTTQAVAKGKYWAPCYSDPGAIEVDCAHFARPISRLHRAEKTPSVGAPTQQGASLEVVSAPRCSTLDACVSKLSRNPHIALVRFTAMNDPRNMSTRYSHLYEDQIFVRTTYAQAFEKMESDIHAPLDETMKEGGIIYTSDVGILRGSLEEGAKWLDRPPKVDVIWIGLPSHPTMLADSEQYANESDHAAMLRTISRAFACAAAHGADAVVLPPIGCGTHGCKHPGLDVADIIHQAANMYKGHISQVCVASDHPAHAQEEWWDSFAAAVQNGRSPPEKKSSIPPIVLPPWVMPPPRNACNRLDKETKRLTGRSRLSA